MRLIHYITLILLAGSCTTNHVKDDHPFLIIIPDTTKTQGKNLNEWRMNAMLLSCTIYKNLIVNVFQLTISKI